MRRLLVAVMLTLLFVHSASAATIGATASSGPFDNPVVDEEGPATSGSVLVEAVEPNSGITARAALDVVGNSAVALNGVYVEAKGLQLAGGTFPQVCEGETSWSESITNTSARPKSYVYSFHLNPIRLTLVDFTANGSETDSLAPMVSYRVEVRVNGDVLIFESQAEFVGGIQSHVLNETGTDLGGTYSNDEASLTYTFSPYNGTFSAGTVGPGETISVETTLRGNTEAHFNFSGGIVSIGDPLDLKGDPGVDSMIFEEDDSIGVEPASWSTAKQLFR